MPMQTVNEPRHPLAMSDREWKRLPQDKKERVLKEWDALSNKDREEALMAIRKYGKNKWWLSKDTMTVAKYQRNEKAWLAVNFSKEELEKAEEKAESSRAAMMKYICFDLLRNK